VFSGREGGGEKEAVVGKGALDESRGVKEKNIGRQGPTAARDLCIATGDPMTTAKGR